MIKHIPFRSVIRCLGFVVLLLTGVLLASTESRPVLAQDLKLFAASGQVEKSSKGSLSIQPRNAAGQFEKIITLTVTETARITTLIPQKRKGKLVITQKETDPKDLMRSQPIAITYTVTQDGPVLLSAVVQLK